MAYVRKTETLVYEIIQKVREMSRKAQEPYQADTVTSGSPEYKAISDAVEDVSWKLAPHLKNEMPAKWAKRLSKAEKVEVKIPAPSSCPDSGSLRVYIERQSGFCLSPEHYDPHASNYTNPMIKFEAEDVPPVVLNWFASGKSNEATKAGLQAKFDKVEEQLKEFMKQHASLNTAIKAMPEIEHYVPVEFIDKLKAPSKPRGKVQRDEKTTAEELGIDVDALTSAAVAHQIASAGSE